MIKILHTGDIHLDSPFSGLDEKHSEIRRNELRSTFTAMMTYVRTNNVDVVLMAGDLFDSEFVTRETIGIIIRELARCGAQVFIVAGNHDYITPDSVYAKEGIFPENVHIFKSESLEKISVDGLGLDVYGYSFETPYLYENPIADRHVEDEERLNILLCHADTRSKNSCYCPIDEAMIEGFGADYTAIGHIHNAEKPKKAGNCVYAYCGCPEGRNFNEVGEKGALLIEIEKNGTKVSNRIHKLRFSKRRYQRDEIDVSGATTLGEISEKIAEFTASAGYGEETLLSLTLRGAVSPSLVVNADWLAKNVKGLFFAEIADATTPEASTDALGGDSTVKGRFYKELEIMLTGENEEDKKLAEAALRYGLSALEGANITDY